LLKTTLGLPALYICYMSVNNFNNGTDSKKRILDSARKEILEKGIIGMRVQDVAKGADTSITLIYRYFVDRNGVLARVLGDMYDDFRLSFQTKVEAWLAVNDSLSLEDFARLMPNPAEETKHARDFRLQVLATALENPELNERIKAVTTSTYRWMRDTIEANRHKLPAEERGFDARFMTVIMFNLMFVYYDLVDEDKISADDYRAMLVNQIRNSAQRTVSS
jgi:AcrR family transcriptional regulator